MEAINTAFNESRKAGVRRPKKIIPRIDMTPMVDLGFLLICFFVISTELSKPVLVKLNMPTAEGPDMQLGNSNALTVILNGNNKAWYYHGNWKEAIANNAVLPTDFSSAGLRKIIIEKKGTLNIPGSKEGKDGLMLIVKSTGNGSYKNVVDILDEVMINGVKKYAIIKLELEETEWLKGR
jgi:biopolymer transport protein ExbD